MNDQTPDALRRRRAKILAAVGPASSAPEMLRRLFLAGADTFRLNFSHGSHDDHRSPMRPSARWKPSSASPSAPSS